jgi:hypothetical protein
VLGAAGIWHPRTFHVVGGLLPAHLPLPCVVKPRFGSWGTDVVLCRSRDELYRALAAVSSKSWWQRHGALVQELVPPVGRDLPLLVAGGEVVGGAMRVAASGEWRTPSPGQLEPAVPSPAAVAEAERSAGAGHRPPGRPASWDGGWVVLEPNGAVDFDEAAPQDATCTGDAGCLAPAKAAAGSANPGWRRTELLERWADVQEG